MKELDNLFKIVSVIMLLACTEEVTPPSIEDVENKVVVNAVISPFLDQIAVEVSFSKKAFGIIPDQFGSSDLIRDASVTISNDTQEASLIYDFSLEQYVVSTAAFPLVEGATYRLDVVADEGTVYAETTLPKSITELQSYNYNSSSDMFEVAWIDIPEEENYYRVSAFGHVPVEFGFVNTFFFDSDEFVSDINKNGERISARGEGFSSGTNYDSVTVRIISCDELYHDYFKTLTNFVEDDPFADPVRLPSNIEGGLGIFTAVQVSEFKLDL